MKTLIHRAHIELFLLREKVRDLRENKSGAAMIEYSILIGLITAAVIATIVLVGEQGHDCMDHSQYQYDEPVVRH